MSARTFPSRDPHASETDGFTRGVGLAQIVHQKLKRSQIIDAVVGITSNGIVDTNHTCQWMHACFPLLPPTVWRPVAGFRLAQSTVIEAAWTVLKCLCTPMVSLLQAVLLQTVSLIIMIENHRTHTLFQRLAIYPTVSKLLGFANEYLNCQTLRWVLSSNRFDMMDDPRTWLRCVKSPEAVIGRSRGSCAGSSPSNMIEPSVATIRT